MTSRRFRAGTTTIAIGLALAACGGGKSSSTTTSATTPATTSTTTAATTTTPPAAVYPLTGLPATNAAAAARPALVIKIDNAEPRARPQQGLNQADVVYEEMVEGFVSRFAAVFQSTDALNRVVPVRSARTTDIALFTPLDHPLFAWSGANRDFTTLIRQSPMVDVGYDAFSSAYHRDPHRYATHDLWTTTQALWSRTPAGAHAPPALFTYRPAGDPPPPPPAAAAATHAYLSFGGGGGSAPVDWVWNAARGGWLRSQKGTPDVDETGLQIGPANVIFQFVTYHDTGYVDTSGAKVYEADLVGSGDCWVLTDGAVVKGHWQKTSATAITTYTDAAGNPIGLTPGQTWVELPWVGHAVTSVQ